MNKKKAYYKLRKDSTLYANEVVLQNFVALMENSPLEKILNVNDKMTALDFEAALLENQEIISDKLYIQNRKTVNTIYLNLLQNGNVLSSEDSLSLQNIALITPYLGGDAVYSARILLGIDAMDYGIQYRGEGTSIEFEPTQSGVNVYPNPVQNQLHIDILKPVTEQVFVRVYNSTGTELAYNKVNGITGTINTEQFAAGIYLYKVYTLNKILQQGKFIKLPTISR